MKKICIYVDGEIKDITSEQIQELEEKHDAFKDSERTRPFTESEMFLIFTKQNINNLEVDDNTALRMISYHPTWEELCNQGFVAEKAGFRFQHEEKLYKTVQSNFTFQNQWVPGEGTSAIYVQVVETQSGTIDDPIDVPADVLVNAFAYVTGKYYKWNGIIYKCERTGVGDGVEYNLNYPPNLLIGNYFTQI